MVENERVMSLIESNNIDSIKLGLELYKTFNQKCFLEDAFDIWLNTMYSKKLHNIPYTTSLYTHYLGVGILWECSSASFMIKIVSVRGELKYTPLRNEVWYPFGAENVANLKATFIKLFLKSIE